MCQSLKSQSLFVCLIILKIRVSKVLFRYLLKIFIVKQWINLFISFCIKLINFMRNLRFIHSSFFALYYPFYFGKIIVFYLRILPINDNHCKRPSKIDWCCTWTWTRSIVRLHPTKPYKFIFILIWYDYLIHLKYTKKGIIIYWFFFVYIYNFNEHL